MRYRAANNAKHAFTTDRAAYALLYVITFRCSSSPCSSFIAFCLLLRPTEHIARPIPTAFCFCPHATRQTRLSAPGLPTDAYRYATHLHFARFARDIYAISPQKPIHARFCRRTAARRPTPALSAPSIPASGAGERISLCSRFMWNIRLVIRQNLNVYRGFCSFMHIYTLRYCMFFSYAFAFAVPAILFHCRSVSDARASTPLSYTRFRIPPSRTRAVSSIRVCILFPRSSLSSPVFSISFHLTLAIGVTFALFACTFL